MRNRTSYAVLFISAVKRDVRQGRRDRDIVLLTDQKVLLPQSMS